MLDQCYWEYLIFPGPKIATASPKTNLVQVLQFQVLRETIESSMFNLQKNATNFQDSLGALEALQHSDF